LTAGDFAATVAVDRPGLGIHNVAWAGKPLEAIRYWLALSEPPAPPDQLREIEDAYVRGRDLVAVYAETAEHPLRYVMYWRALSEGDLCGAVGGLDVVVSVQTSTLDATPAAWLSSQSSVDGAWSCPPSTRSWAPIAARSGAVERDELLKVAGDESAHGTASCDDTFFFDLAGMPLSYGEMIHPRDRMASDAIVAEGPGVPPLGTSTSDTSDEALSQRIARARHRLLGLRLEKDVLVRSRLRVVLARRDGAREVVAACREAFEQAELPLTT
jgi:hypothetical protein